MSDRLQARLTTLHAVTHTLARPLDERAMLRGIHAELARSLDVTICFFGRYDHLGQSVDVTWQIHEGVELEGGHFPLGSGPTSQVIRSCQPRLIRAWSTDGPRVQVQYATDRPVLPESSITVPVVFDGAVIGVLAVQSYRGDAYDQDDVALLQSVADLLAVALMARGEASAPVYVSDLEAILASMDDALLVLDTQGRVVRVNQAARRLLCLDEGSIVLGYPVDRAQAEHWPLGTQQLTEQLRPIVDQLRSGAALPPAELSLTLDGAVQAHVSCRASLLLKDEVPSGAVMVLRATP